jgi:hypothetical protein
MAQTGMKDHLELDGVALLGRTFEEYSAFFQFNENELQTGRILDMGAGISSFCSEAVMRGYNVTAADPIYRLSPQVIAAKAKADLTKVEDQLPEIAHQYNWTFYRTANDLRRYRETAREGFLKDYASNRNRYIPASLPQTGFRDREFDLVLVSHFLFLYDEHFDYEFHKRSILELQRITRSEIRIYPLANLRTVKSAFVPRLLNDADCSGLQFTIRKSKFEFFKNCDELLVLRPAMFL